MISRNLDRKKKIKIKIKIKIKDKNPSPPNSTPLPSSSPLQVACPPLWGKQHPLPLQVALGRGGNLEGGVRGKLPPLPLYNGILSPAQICGNTPLGRRGEG